MENKLGGIVVKSIKRYLIEMYERFIEKNYVQVHKKLDEIDNMKKEIKKAIWLGDMDLRIKLEKQLQFLNDELDVLYKEQKMYYMHLQNSKEM